MENKIIQNLYKLNWKVFWIGFLAGSLGIFLSHMGVRPPKIFNLVNSEIQKANIVPFLNSEIEPKLKEKINNFELKRNSSFQNLDKSLFDKDISYIAIDFDTGEILFEKNAQEKQSIASLTKLMTAVVAEDLALPSDYFVVSYEATKVHPTTIGVVENQKMTVEELLNAILLTSANDAAQVIKEGIDNKYGEENFIRAMNKKAQLLGLKNTKFDNPQGFDSKNNYSTPQDLAILSSYALKNYPLLTSIVQKDYEFLPKDKNHKQFDLYNWNGLLDVYPNVQGVKIGNTDSALNTIIVLSEREGKKVLVVLLGAPTVIDRDLWASQLLDLGFGKNANLSSVNVSEDQLKQKYSTWKYWN